MNKKEWTAFFEEINSRKPSEEELDQALKAGEFSEDIMTTESDEHTQTIEPINIEEVSESIESEEVSEPIEVDEIVEELIEEPGNDAIEEDQKEPETPKQKSIKENETVTQVTSTTKNYFSWLWETFKHPISKGDNYSQAYPWITMGLISLLFSLTVTLYFRSMYAVSTTIGNAFINAYTANSYVVTNPFGFKVFISLFVCFAILIITLVFATWVGLKVMGSRLSFTNVIDQYASLYVPVVILIAISTVLSLITLRILGMIVLLLALSILSISWYFIIFNAKNERKLDDFYSKLLALLCGGAIMVGIYSILILFIFTRMLVSMPTIF